MHGVLRLVNSRGLYRANTTIIRIPHNARAQDTDVHNHSPLSKQTCPGGGPILTSDLQGAEGRGTVVEGKIFVVDSLRTLLSTPKPI